MDQSNHCSDFEPDQFTIYAWCESCKHSAPVDHSGLDMTTAELQARLRCNQCGSRKCSIQIVFTGYGPLTYR